MPRLDPIPPDQWPPEMGEVIGALFPDDSRHPLPINDGKRPQGFNVLGLLAHHPALAAAYHHFNGYVLYMTQLSERQRELVILRIAHRRACDYEWAQHAWFANDLGMSDDEIARIAEHGDPDAWDDLDAALLTAVDDLLTDARIGDETWAVLERHLDTRTLFDLIFTVGAYDLVAMTFRSFDLPLDPDLADVLRTWPR